MENHFIAWKLCTNYRRNFLYLKKQKISDGNGRFSLIPIAR